jgi:SAM-dependent methyltransferase
VGLPGDRRRAAPEEDTMTALDDLVGKVVADAAATFTGTLVRLGDELGLWRALAAGPADPAELAARAGIGERYAAEWLPGVAAAGYAAYDPRTGTYALTPEQATVFADDTSPVFLTGLYLPALAGRWRAGTGFGWHEHHDDLFTGTERFFRPGYAANLPDAWLPALDGVVAKLRAGARVADVGCGHGTSTVVIADAFPATRLWGFDYHAGSIERAAELAKRAGVDDRVAFAVAPAGAIGGGPYDLICLFDSLHDMGDPVAVLAHLRGQLAPDGTVMLVEPNAGDAVADNLNPVGQLFYAASATICVPGGLSQAPGRPLGAQAGPARTLAAAREAGFGRVREADRTPFNLVYELRA